MKPIVRLAAGVALIALLSACSLLKPARTEPPPAPPPKPAALATKLFGVAVLGARTSLKPVKAFADVVGKKPRIVSGYYGWGELPKVSVLRAIKRYGALPLINLNSDQTPLSRIISGKDDGYLRELGQDLNAVGSTLAVCFDAEMNGNWYPWGYQHVSPAQFVAAWRHIHSAVVRAGARNVIWVWAPNVTNHLTEPMAPLWPGDRYVDWVGLHGYYGTVTSTFALRFKPSLQSISQFTKKPVLISETAVANTPNRVQQIHNLISGVASTPGVIGFVWFDFNARMQWRIDGDPAAVQAFRRGLSSGSWRGSGLVVRL